MNINEGSMKRSTHTHTQWHGWQTHIEASTPQRTEWRKICLASHYCLLLLAHFCHPEFFVVFVGGGGGGGVRLAHIRSFVSLFICLLLSCPFCTLSLHYIHDIDVDTIRTNWL